MLISKLNYVWTNENIKNDVYVLHSYVVHFPLYSFEKNRFYPLSRSLVWSTAVTIYSVVNNQEHVDSQSGAVANMSIILRVLCSTLFEGVRDEIRYQDKKRQISLNFDLILNYLSVFLVRWQFLVLWSFIYVHFKKNKMWLMKYFPSFLNHYILKSFNLRISEVIHNYWRNQHPIEFHDQCCLFEKFCIYKRCIIMKCSNRARAFWLIITHFPSYSSAEFIFVNDESFSFLCFFRCERTSISIVFEQTELNAFDSRLIHRQAIMSQLDVRGIFDEHYQKFAHVKCSRL